jgi:hypothetical protein
MADWFATVSEADVLRVLNVGLAVVALAILGWSGRGRWGHWTPRTRFFWQSLVVFCVTVAYGSIENIVQGNLGGLRTPLTTVACIWVIWGGLLRGGYTHEHHEGSGDDRKEVEDDEFE